MCKIFCTSIMHTVSNYGTLGSNVALCLTYRCAFFSVIVDGLACATSVSANCSSQFAEWDYYQSFFDIWVRAQYSNELCHQRCDILDARTCISQLYFESVT